MLYNMLTIFPINGHYRIVEGNGNNYDTIFEADLPLRTMEDILLMLQQYAQDVYMRGVEDGRDSVNRL